MLDIRRVVTGHDENGRAVVKSDGKMQNIVENRPGATWSVIWTTEGFPVDNTDGVDGSTRKVQTSAPNGTVFRVVRYDPGVAPRMHRTDSIDYAVVLSGAIVMQLDDTEVHLQAGDVLVQRGTIHNWINRGTEPCFIAFVLIDAKPVNAGGKVMQAEG